MASESTEEPTVSVSLPGELHEWLETQATSQDIDQETLVVQLLTAYRETAEFDGDLDGEVRVVDSDLEGLIEDEFEAELKEATTALQDKVERHVTKLEREYEQQFDNLEDIVDDLRETVEETAEVGHSHDEFETIESLTERVESLSEAVDSLREANEEVLENDLAELDQRIADLEDRNETLAWVVSDLREAQEGETELDVVDRIKRVAGAADIERANCQGCGEGVAIGLLVEPECPHCGTSVRDVEPADGWFGSPTLVTGTPTGAEDNEEDSDDAAEDAADDEGEDE